MNDMGRQLRDLSQRLRERHADVPAEITDKLETILRRFDEGGDKETVQEDTWEKPSRLSLEHELHKAVNKQPSDCAVASWALIVDNG